MTSLPSRLCAALPVLLALACGEDAEKRYAGLDVARVSLADGHGYLLRYLAPPWERLENDPLADDRLGLVAFGASPDCRPSTNDCRSVEPGGSTVLEIERSSVSANAGSMRLPKYRLEATYLRCADDELAEGDLCARVLAEADELGRRDPRSDDTVIQAKDGENDLGQPYRELLTASKSTGRYRRVVYFETGSPDLTLRLAFEANPSLAEVEVTRMIAACELTNAAESP